MEFNNFKNDFKKRVCALAFALSVITTLPSCTANQNRNNGKYNSSGKITNSTIDDTKDKLYNNYLGDLHNSINIKHINLKNQNKPSGLTLDNYEFYITTVGDWYYIHDSSYCNLLKINKKTGEKKKVSDFGGNSYIVIGNFLYVSSADFVKIDLTNDKETKINNNVEHSICTNSTMTKMYYIDIFNNNLYECEIATGKTTVKASGVASDNVQVRMIGDNVVEVNNAGTKKTYTIN